MYFYIAKIFKVLLANFTNLKPVLISGQTAIECQYIKNSPTNPLNEAHGTPFLSQI